MKNRSPLQLFISDPPSKESAIGCLRCLCSHPALSLLVLLLLHSERQTAGSLVVQSLKTSLGYDNGRVGPKRLVKGLGLLFPLTCLRGPCFVKEHPSPVQ